MITPRIVLMFTVGGRHDRKNCRLVLGGAIELQSVDALGYQCWIRVGSCTGMPSTEALTVKALTKLAVFAIEPLGSKRVVEMHDADAYLTVDLGDCTP